MKSATWLFWSLALLAMNISSAAAQEATRKPAGPQNLEVFQDMREDRALLSDTMQFMRASLGVHCDFCHVTTQQTGWQFDKDDRPAKIKAREMVRMVMEINRVHFAGEPIVTCYTCHQGHVQPTAWIPLPQTPPPFPTPFPQPTSQAPVPWRPASVATADPNKPAASSGTAVSPRQILDRHLAAMGGAQLASGLRTRILKGTFTSFDDKPYPVEIAQEAPAKYLAKVTLPRGIQQRGFDGSTGWRAGPDGVRALEGGHLKQVMDDARMDRLSAVGAGLKDLRALGRSTEDGREFDVLEGIADDRRVERLWFDAGTGLLSRRALYTRTPIGVLEDRQEFDDWRDTGGGLKAPFVHRLIFMDPWTGGTRRFTEIHDNVPIDPGLFAMPKPAEPPPKG